MKSSTSLRLPPPTRLRCEFTVDPIGVGERQPRLSWRLTAAERGIQQTAYQVQVASDVERLRNGSADLWDSGRVSSDESVHVFYSGQPLRSRQRCWWRVRVWDASSVLTEWSSTAYWELALLEASDWSASWIGTSLVGDRQTGVPCPLLRKEFSLPADVRYARLYVTALGLYEFSLNGTRVGRDVFTPGWTDYARRVPYHVYDVTAMLRRGTNVAGAILGDGWYCGHIAQFGRQIYGDRPWLLAQLHVQGDNGEDLRIVTDESWQWRASHVASSDMLMGESCDGRLEVTGWQAPLPQNAQSSWQPVQVKTDVAAKVVAAVSPPVRETQLLRPVAPPVRVDEQHWNHHHWVFDFGQNFSGRVRLTVRGKKGQVIRLRHAEVLNPNGTLYTQNLRTATATDWYTCRGDEAGETFEPRFVYHGFRYVEVRGLDGTPSVDDVVGVVLHSDTPVTGHFECSNQLVNQLQRNVTWGQRSNFVEVPTDCPQRDERLGWTGDAQVFIRTASFNMDVASFFTKWQDDLLDAQSVDGAYPEVVPNVLPGGKDGGPGWAEAGIICAWTIYECYGDRRLLERHYDGMQRFVRYLEQTSSGCVRGEDPKLAYWGFGDWLAVDAVDPGSAPTPRAVIGTAYFAVAVDLMARIAGVLGRREDQYELGDLLRRIRAAFNEHFVTPAGRVVGHTQTGYLLALAYDLLPEDKRDIAVGHLVDLIRHRGWRLTTGFLGTPLLCPVLTRFGRSDVAYRLLTQESYPSWLYTVRNGATTMWERWNSYSDKDGFADARMNSFNHYAYGAIGQWLYTTVGGLAPDPARPGYQSVRCAPQPGGDIRWARTRLDTGYGTIATSWAVEADRFTLDLTVPPNVSATVQLPEGCHGEVSESGAATDVTKLDACDGKPVPSFRVGSGSYRFQVGFKTRSSDEQ